MSPPERTGDTGIKRMTAWQRAVITSRRLQLARLSLVALAALLVGVGIGRWTVPDGDRDARAAVEDRVQPLALEADDIWTSQLSGDRPAVAEGVPMIRRGERLDDVEIWAADWLEAYDTLLIRLTGLDLTPEARPVQRQFVSAVTLSRDAVDVLRQAAAIDDEGTRETLVGESLRLRERAEHLTQSARAAVRDLGGGDGEVARHPDLPEIEELQDG